MKKLVIIFFIIISNSQNIFSEETILLKYKPAKLIKYEISGIIFDIINSKSYDIKTCTYSYLKIGENLNLVVKLDADSRSCLGKFANGRLFPQKLESKYLIHENGQIIESDKNKLTLSIFRLIPVRLSIKNSITFLPITLPKFPIQVSKDYVVTNEKIIDGKKQIINKNFKCKHFSIDHIAEIEYSVNINNIETVTFIGLFDNKKGYWKYWEFYSKNNNQIKLINKFNSIEYIQ